MPSALPAVSVVTVCLNAADTLENTIQSVVSQTYPNLDYIIIDGESSDGTVPIIQRYAHNVSFWISEPDRGLYDAMNKAIQYVHGDYVVFLNADDVFAAPDTVETMINRAEKQPSSQLIFGDVLVKFPDKTLYKKQASPVSKWRLWKGNPVCHQSLFAHRSVFDAVGLFDTSMPVAADWDWLARAIVQAGCSAIHLPIPVCVFNAGGVSSNRNAYETDKKRIHERYFSPAEQRVYSVMEIAYKIKVRLKMWNFALPWKLSHRIKNMK
ncbi:MAG: glycosyltransferase [Anaerolineae bacterium]|nr:glycosyltransferase [Anaerolineae bacterium]